MRLETSNYVGHTIIPPKVCRVCTLAVLVYLQMEWAVFTFCQLMLLPVKPISVAQSYITRL